MPKAFAKSLSELVHSSVEVSPYPLDVGTYGEKECGAAPVYLAFQSGALLRTDYWRVIESGKSTISSFDHRQQYGLPERIDAIKVLGGLFGWEAGDECIRGL